jgi:hypothetical protein
LLVAAVAAASPAAAQDVRSDDDTRAAAESAPESAVEAQPELDAAGQRAEPETAADEAEPSVDEATERAERAERRAKAADRRAQEALARVEELESRFAYDRTGLYIGGSAFYAPETFDEGHSVSVKSSRGAMARIGYRVHSIVAFDVRADYLEGFDVFSGDASGEIDGYSITGNVRAFLIPYRLQPWIGFGVGAIRTDFDARLDDGERVETDGVETDPLFRFAAGFDTYLTSSLVLTLEAAINIVTDDRDYINYGQLGVGLDFRF